MLIPFVEPAEYLGNFVRKGDVYDFRVSYSSGLLDYIIK